MKIIQSIAFAIVLAVPAVTADAQQFRMLSSWDKNYANNPVILNPFMQGVEAASKGRMKFTVSGPETVPPFEQLEPLASGAFDFLFTAGSYHFGTTPILSVMGALEGDLASVRASGILEEADKYYKKFGVKILALPITPNGGYHIMLKQPVGPSGDLQGRKIRGTPVYASVITMLGGAMTVLPPAEIYTSLEKGVVDGAAWPVNGALSFRWNEVAKYLLRPAFGVETAPILVNLNTWNRLSEEDRAIIQQEARKVEDLFFRDAVRMWREEETALLAQGVSLTFMGDAQKSKLQDAWSSGMWTLAAEKQRNDVEALRQFARSKKVAR
ncbi:MAG: C4-dicarboxylate ABC transporter substrate-binding protein [Rhodospirillales bacterium]|nr:C4-dicarboxylate ABC transporter substrate-binding protein [Rhodospirillales bacterium]